MLMLVEAAMFGFAQCENRQNTIHIQFKKINSRTRFEHLVNDFKETFPDRIWLEGKWVIPGSQLSQLEEFCFRRGLELRWLQTQYTQLTFGDLKEN